MFIQKTCRFCFKNFSNAISNSDGGKLILEERKLFELLVKLFPEINLYLVKNIEICQNCTIDALYAVRFQDGVSFKRRYFKEVRKLKLTKKICNICFRDFSRNPKHLVQSSKVVAVALPQCKFTSDARFCKPCWTKAKKIFLFKSTFLKSQRMISQNIKHSSENTNSCKKTTNDVEKYLGKIERLIPLSLKRNFYSGNEENPDLNTTILTKFNEEDPLQESKNKSQESCMEITAVFCNQNEDDEYINEDKESYSSDDIFEEEEQVFSDTDDIFNEKSESTTHKIQQEIVCTRNKIFSNELNVIHVHDQVLEEDDIFNEESKCLTHKILQENVATQYKNDASVNNFNSIDAVLDEDDIFTEKYEGSANKIQQENSALKNKVSLNDINSIDVHDEALQKDDIFNEKSECPIHKIQQEIVATQNTKTTPSDFNVIIDSDVVLEEDDLFIEKSKSIVLQQQETAVIRNKEFSNDANDIGVYNVLEKDHVFNKKTKSTTHQIQEISNNKNIATANEANVLNDHGIVLDEDNFFNKKAVGTTYPKQNIVGTNNKANSSNILVIFDRDVVLHEDDIEKSGSTNYKIQQEISATQNRASSSDVNTIDDHDVVLNNIFNKESGSTVSQKLEITVTKNRASSKDVNVIGDQEVILEEDDMCIESCECTNHKIQQEIRITKNSASTNIVDVIGNPDVELEKDDIFNKKSERRVHQHEIVATKENLNLKNKCKVNKTETSSGMINDLYIDLSDDNEVIMIEEEKSYDFEEDSVIRKNVKEQQRKSSDKNKDTSDDDDDDDVILIEQEKVIIDLTKEISITDDYTKEININKNHISDVDDIFSEDNDCQSNDQKKFTKTNKSKITKVSKRRKKRRKKTKTKLNYNHKDIIDKNNVNDHSTKKDCAKGKNTIHTLPEKIQNDGESKINNKKIVDKPEMRKNQAIFYPMSGKAKLIGHSTSCQTISDPETDLQNKENAKVINNKKIVEKPGIKNDNRSKAINYPLSGKLHFTPCRTILDLETELEKEENAKVKNNKKRIEKPCIKNDNHSKAIFYPLSGKTTQKGNSTPCGTISDLETNLEKEENAKVKNNKKIIEKPCLKNDNYSKAIFYPLSGKATQKGNSTPCRTISDLETNLSTFVAIKPLDQNANTDRINSALLKEYYAMAREIENTEQNVGCSLELQDVTNNNTNINQNLQNGANNIIQKTIIGENFQHTENTIQMNKALLGRSRKTSYFKKNLEIKTYLARTISNFKRTCDLVSVDTLSKKLASIKKVNVSELQKTNEKLNQVYSKLSMQSEPIENKTSKGKSWIEEKTLDQCKKPSCSSKRKRKKLPPLVPLISKNDKKQKKEPLQSGLMLKQKETQGFPRITNENLDKSNPEEFRYDYRVNEENSKGLMPEVLKNNNYYGAAEQNSRNKNPEVLETNYYDQYYSNNLATSIQNTYDEQSSNTPHFSNYPQNYYEPLNNNYSNNNTGHQVFIENQSYFGSAQVQPNYWQNQQMDYDFCSDDRCYPRQQFPPPVLTVMPPDIQWSCHLCMAKFEQHHQLYGHLGFHVDPMYYYYDCQKCSFRTTNMIEVRQHLEYCVMDQKVLETQDFNQRFICHICLEIFSEKLAVHNHIQMHEASPQQYRHAPT